MQQDLSQQLQSVYRAAIASKFERMLRNPWKYFEALIFRTIIYGQTKRAKEVETNTFFSLPMTILLPSSTDIYLTGGKSHSSEISLAQLIINRVKAGDTFLDIGAHYGYFSLLASQIVGKNGKVISFEAAPNTFSILQKNQSKVKNMTAFHNAVSDENGYLTFYEFPNQYSEYNTIDVTQFENEAWIKDFPPKVIKVESVILDAFFKKNDVKPNFIKIDVEGAELKVLNGMKSFLQTHSPLLAMEYLSATRGNEAHVQSEQLMRECGFSVYKITNQGELVQIDDVELHLNSQNIDSDNIVFMK